MEEFSLKELVDWTEGEIVNIKDEIVFNNVCTDSRTILSGCVFVALKGKNFDGHDFVQQAIKSGAKAAVVEKIVDSRLPQILVKDTLVALGNIAKNYRKRFGCPIIGITGSDGKTTTKEMCSHLLSSRFNVCKNHGNFNNEVGLPLSIFSLSSQTDIGVFELGMNGYGQLRYLGSILQPDIAVITSVGYAHIGFFKNRSDLARTKAEIVDSLLPEGLVIVNNDTGFINFFSGKTIFPPVQAGFKNGSNFKGIMVEYKKEMFTLQIKGWDNLSFRINSWNGAIAYPCLFSIFIADYFGIPRRLISRLVNEFVLLDGRGKIKESGGIRIIDESYNANPGSMESALRYFSMQEAKRRIAVIGEMAELGKHSELYHKRIGHILKDLTIDFIFTTGKDARVISDICKEKSSHFENSLELAECVSTFVKKGDIVLVKGSRINRLETVVERILEETEN